MAATPYKATLTFQGMRTKNKVNYIVTASDVANAKWIFPSGQDNLQLPADQPYALVSAVYTSAGVDTTQVYVYANQKDTGERIQNTAHLYTSQFPPIRDNPMGFKAGTNVYFVQMA